MKCKFILTFCSFVIISLAHANNRIIIKYKNSSTSQLSNTSLIFQSSVTSAPRLTSDNIKNLSKLSNTNILRYRLLNTGAYTIRFDKNFDNEFMVEFLQKIQADPNVEYVVEDKLLNPLVFSSNPLQWDMYASIGSLNGDGGTWHGDNFVGAWSLITGNGTVPGNKIVIANIDTGYTPHPNFIMNLESDSSGNHGYDFIQNCVMAGTCPNTTVSASVLPSPDALDYGDFLSQDDINADPSLFSNCSVSSTSSWHGTHVTGTLIGQGYSGSSGVLGGAYGAHVLPVRVLGKCGGYTSDIIDGMSWAVGQSSVAAPTNLAKVMNMSLGGEGSCDQNLQDAINSIVFATNNAIIVVAAGNSAEEIINFNPSGCANVIVVAAKGPGQALSYYSNYGATNVIASGGDEAYYNAYGGVYSTLWSSATNYISPESGGAGIYVDYQGTSMATPHVTAAVADLISLIEQKSSPQNQWNYTRIVQLLQNTADYSGWSSGSNCLINDDTVCTASGMMNVESAISYVLNNYTQLLEPNINVVRFDSSTPLTKLITFTNNNESSVHIPISDIVYQGNFTISSDSCSGNILTTGETCNIVVSVINSSLTDQAGYLQISNSDGVPVATINLYYSSELIEPSSFSTTQSTVNVFGGGCSMLQDTRGNNDMSLLILLGLLSIWFWSRKKC